MGIMIIFLLVCKLHTLDGRSRSCPPSVPEEYCDSNCPPHCALVGDKHLICDKKTTECLNGCKRGWYGSRCHHPCSKNCFDRICNQHNGFCTLPCPAHYTGDFCEVHTKQSTESTKACLLLLLGYPVLIVPTVVFIVRYCRQRRSISREAHIKNRPYAFVCTSIVFDTCGTEKSQRKSEYFSLLLVFITPLLARECPHCLHNDCDSTGLCIKGCKTGFADKYCQHVCPETCQQSRCEVGAAGAIVCCLGCIDGYQGPRCNIPCAEGHKHCSLSPSNGSSEYKSNHCKQHSCEHTCKGFACNDQGACLSTCTDGRFGANCSLTCRSHQQSCKQDSGQCVECKHGYFGDICEKICPNCLPRWEDKVQKCKPICTEEDKDHLPECQSKKNAGSPTSHLEQEMRVITTILVAICVVLLILSIICVYLLRRNCGTTSKGWSDEYNTPGENERLLNQNDAEKQQERATTLQNGETDS